MHQEQLNNKYPENMAHRTTAVFNVGLTRGLVVIA